MRKKIRLKQDAHRRAQAVCNENRSIIEASKGGTKALAALDASVGTVDRNFVDQQKALTDRRTASGQCRDARQIIRSITSAIVGVSSGVELDEGSKKVMVVPAVATDELLMAEATAIYETVSTHAAAFTDAGLPEADLVALRDQIGVLRTARTAVSNARKTFTALAKESRTAATAGSDALVVVDAILARAPGADPKALGKLRSAKRIGPSHAGETPAPAAHPAPAPAPEPTTPTRAA